MMKKIASIVLSFGLVFAMTGCNNNKNKEDPHKYTKFTKEELDALPDVYVEVYYYNWGEEIQEKEKIFFTYDETMYNACNIPIDGLYRTEIKNTPGYIMSSYLKDEISIPHIKDGEKLIVEVDYEKHTLTAHVEPVGEIMTELQTEANTQ